MSTLTAGAAVVDITPGVGLPMGGYGRRSDPSAGVADPLCARVMVLSDGDTEVVIAVCDLLGVGTDLVADTRRLVQEATGIPGGHVLMAATHTHGGPAGFRHSDAPEYVAVTARKVAGAASVARRSARPVRLKLGSFDMPSIGRNRRHPDGPFQDTGVVLLADPGRLDPPVATLVSFACHATVLEHDNLEYSADFPGAANRLIEGSLGGTAVYLQGACGDINPVWSAHDHREVDRVGGVLGAAAVRLVHEMRPLDSGQWYINLSWSEDVPVEARGRLLTGGPLACASTTVELERRHRPAPDDLDRRRRELAAELDALGADRPSERRRLRAELNELDVAVLFARAGAGRPTQRLEVQAIRLAPECAVVTLPGEFFIATGQDIARRVKVEHLLVAGYANGAVGYVPPADEYPEAGYEVGMSQFGPGAAEAVADAAVALVDSLF